MLSTRRATLRNSLIPSQAKHVSIVAPQSESGESAACQFDKKDFIFENTYKMIPDQKFLSGKTKAYIEEILAKKLQDMEYDDEKAKKMCTALSEEIQAKVKENWLVSRYKLVCLVNIGKPMGQGMRITSRCLWNPAFDTYVTASYATDKIFGQACVYAVYLE